MKKNDIRCARELRERVFRIVLLPHGEVAAERLSLREAVAWVEGYNEIMRRALPHAVVVEERTEQHVA